jgi:leucyl aminopeptidase
MLKIHAIHGTLQTSRAGAVAYFVFEDSKLLKHYRQDITRILGVFPPPFLTKAFTGKDNQTFTFYRTAGKPSSVVFVGLGTRDHLSLEIFRRGAARALTAARRLEVSSLDIQIPVTDLLSLSAMAAPAPPFEAIGMALAEGALLAAYRFDKYKARKIPSPVDVTKVTLLANTRDHLNDLVSGIRRAHLVGRAVYLARDLANAPGNEIYPDTLAQKARAVARGGRMKVRVYGERQIRALKMGGLLGVGQGSARPPRFIVLEHQPRRRKKAHGTIVLVGKGVTFDSGGISIKPSANMAEMKMDMSGAGAVLGTMQAAAAMNLPLHVVGLIPAAENLPGGRALKPGDILRHLNGKTSEIDNTDAEGRLILADALSYASRFHPDLVIDLATLTGAVVVALGHHATGMLGTARDAMDRLKESGARTYERVWELPMFEEYERLLKSEIADVKNVGGRWAGAITGAFFLKKFIGDYPWIHLDIAGTAILEEAQDYTPKGGSGVGVRLLTDFLSHWSRHDS